MTTSRHLSPLHGPDLEAFETMAHRCASPTAAHQAVERVSDQRPVLVGFSGWPVAGKDTVPVELFARLGDPDPLHVYFAVPLKDECDAIIEACRTQASHTSAVGLVIEQQQVPRADAERAVSLVRDAARLEPNLTARSRVVEVRQLLQVWGTEVRREQDPDYWVLKALSPAVEAIAEGRSCYLSDVRFENEVYGAQALGFCVVRLDVDRETVRARLRGRDGLDYDDEALDALLGHPAESSLDGFSDFDLVIDNRGSVEHAVDAVLDFLDHQA